MSRPAFITSTIHEIAFLSSITMSAIISAGLAGAMAIALPHLQRDLSFSTSQLSWIQSAYSLVTGSFLLLFGSLADILGRKRVLLFGSVWLSMWCLIAGFADSWVIICRALQGLGAAAMLPSSIGLLGASYTSGKRRNVAFAIYGAGAPVGFSFGLVFGGICTEFLNWRWIMYFFSIATAALAVLVFFALPRDQVAPDSSLRNLDWTGVIVVTSGLILLIFSLTSAPNASDGWKTPYVLATLVLSVLLLCAFFYYETRIINALIPPAIWRHKNMIAISAVMFAFWGGFNVQSYYATLVFQEIDHSSPLLTTAKFLPMAICGVLVNVLVVFIVGRLTGTILLSIAGTAFLAALLLFSESPSGLIYWAMKFPALCLVVVGADIAFNVANLFYQSSVPLSEKALAGGILSTVTNIGTAFGLALANSVAGTQPDLSKTYQTGLRVGAGLSGLGLCTVIMFIRIGIVGTKPKS